ncbi:MAG: hypothetical protein NVS3B20_14720 [Polyangiales bacterium]
MHPPIVAEAARTAGLTVKFAFGSHRPVRSILANFVRPVTTVAQRLLTPQSTTHGSNKVYAGGMAVDEAHPASFLTALRAVGETLAISAHTVAESFLGQVTREKCSARLAAWAVRVVDQAEIDLEVHGLENIPQGEAFVVMSNHQSHYDVPLMYRTFPGHLRMVAKSELFRIPIFTAAMRAAEMIELDRKDSAKAKASLVVARERLRSGINVWIAPEGTRGVNEELRPFKKGGFILAFETQTRILPVSISGTRNVLPVHTTRIRKGHHVVVRYHQPIDPQSFGVSRREDLVKAVRASIASGLVS